MPSLIQWRDAFDPFPRRVGSAAGEMDVAADHEPRPLLFDCGEQRLRAAIDSGYVD